LRIARRSAPGDLAEKVARTVREQIAAGQLVPGECVLSERALSARMKVSRGTVRRGLERLVKEGLLTREPGRGYSLRGPMDASGGPEGTPHRSTIVFVHGHPQDSLPGATRHGRIWAGAREEAVKAGLLSMTSYMPEEELTSDRAAELGRVAGGVLSDHASASYLRKLLAAGVPVVQIDYHRQPDLAADAVVQDDAGGIGLAVSYLHEHGHRRIGYLDSTPQYRASGKALNAEQRLAGFKATTSDLGIAAECVVREFTGNAAETVAAFLERGVTALVLPHVDRWPEVRAELERRGLGSASDFGLVAWGLEPKPGDEFPCPSSITWGREQMGREGVRRLLMRMRGEKVEPATVLIPCELVDRGTGGRGPARGGKE
jgi:DNA-binding LacI/PurR family transcriptional regulator